MVRGTKKEEASREPNPEAAERKRLKRLAFSNYMLSQTPAKASLRLNPSNTVLKHLGKDILKKSQRRSRYLFSFPGLIAPIGGGGKIGDLKDLGTKNPILYLDFPQGQMKLFGTIVYPKNRYLTLQFSRGGTNATCEDYFDNMIVFSDAWWIGRKDENPKENRLEFPKELYEGHQIKYEFKGGAGAASVVNQGVPKRVKTKMQRAEQRSPETPTDYDLTDSETENNIKDTTEVVPVRHSDRTAGKAYKFSEISSGDDSALNSPGVSEHKEKVVKVNTAVNGHNSVNILITGSLVKFNLILFFGFDVFACQFTWNFRISLILHFVFSVHLNIITLNSWIQIENPYFLVVDIDNENAGEGTQLPQDNKKYASGSKSKKLSRFASGIASKEVSFGNCGSLVQATISSLFRKVEEKVEDDIEEFSNTSVVIVAEMHTCPHTWTRTLTDMKSVFDS